MNKGYNKEDIIDILNKKDLNNEDLYNKEYNKLYNKYKSKYSGSELEYFIKQKLYSNGLKKVMINHFFLLTFRFSINFQMMNQIFLLV